MANTQIDVREVHVAVGVIVREGRVLIARRPDHVHQGGLLEFPGGKVEPEETVQAALVREIAEETSLQIPLKSLQPVICIRHDYGDKRVRLDVWRTDKARGEAHGREGQSIHWVSPNDLRDEDFPVANRGIIRALQLPFLLAITGHIHAGGEGGQQLHRALAALPAGLSERDHARLVLLRAPSMSAEDYRALTESALGVCEPAGAGLILHGPPAVFDDNPGAAGLHLPWREARSLQARPVRDGVWLGVSCHDARQMDHAVAIGADYVVLGPVKPTATHPGSTVLGWAHFRELVSRAPIPVFALGGLTLTDLDEVQQAGGQGVAGIRYWWPQS
ncbi:MAG TPA: Nudix family hydrolase [Marinobacter sp.]|uniref:8-oxo-dGTP diphosphatase n=1 Tax=Marinobacter antarcticus TaxID=564117 RepID=A0A831VXJ6_9GAMM|nr:Nudix family hydrolase [Marinobacter antarcticus]HDZ39559.1 Nudix family hydrolase [Marinobacter sp.]HEA50880.1 Nudix family hydrolase [Marinobacter antarcticus]